MEQKYFQNIELPKRQFHVGGPSVSADIWFHFYAMHVSNEYDTPDLFARYFAYRRVLGVVDKHNQTKRGERDGIKVL
jgi:hypothetical protein